MIMPRGRPRIYQARDRAASRLAKVASRMEQLQARRKNMNNPKRAMVLSFPGYNFLPQRVLTKVRYCMEGEISSGQSLLINDTVLRGNSIYDPEYAAGGGQPLAHDQLATLYNNYKVHTCKVKFSFTNASGVPTRICLLPSNSATSFTSILDACEQPYAKTKSVATYNGGASSVSLVSKKSTKEILGIPSLDDDEESGMGANPDNEWYWHCIISTEPYTATNYIVGAYYIEVVYGVEIFDRITLARS